MLALFIWKPNVNYSRSVSFFETSLVAGLLMEIASYNQAIEAIWRSFDFVSRTFLFIREYLKCIRFVVIGYLAIY